jgi:hypothetical protein
METIARILGVDASQTLESVRVALRSTWPPAALVVLVLLAAAGAVMLYRRETALSRAGRAAMAAARAAAAAVLLAALFAPVVEARIRIPTRPTVLVLTDESASMAIRDTRKDAASLVEAGVALGKLPRDANASRAIDEKLKAELALVSRQELVEAALGRTYRPVLEGMSRRAEVRYFRFAGRLEETAAPWRQPASRSGAGIEPGATRLGAALEAALAAAEGQDVSLAVVVTDGAANAGDAPLEAAQRMRQRGVSLAVVGVGLPRPDDTGLRNLVVPDVVFANDMVPLRVQCPSSGYEKRSTTLVVRLDGTEAARKTVTFSGQAQLEELPFKASRAGGQHALEVTLLPLAGEATTENNVIRRSLRVLDDKIRVLYVEGTPRWEYRYIRAVLKRDPRIDVQFINTEGDKDLARASKEHLGRLPEKEAAAFAYDLVILGDVKASTFTPTQLALLERLVREQGGSLIVLGGRKHMPGEYVDTPLAALLPVRFGAEAWEEVGDDVYPVLTEEGRRSTVMSLERSESRTQALWANIRPLNWVPPVAGAKPGAHVLAELSDGSQRARAFPLVAWQRCGAGKVMFIGTDQIWRLRARAGDKYHLRFWGQAVQFLALSRLLGENRPVRLETGRDEYAVDEPVEIWAHALNDLYEPSTAPTFTAYVGAASGAGDAAAVVLRAVPGMAGVFHGFCTPAAAGRYRLSSTSDDARGGAAQAAAARAARTGDAQAAVKEFDVRAETSEQVETGMQRDLLEKMAATTGGRFLALSEFPLLADAAAGRGGSTTFVKEIELWDNWMIPLAFVLLAASEWAWRRKKNLA